jgi:hypothetical protein
MSRRSFLAGGGAPASFQHGQGGRYAAFSCQGLIHRFRRYLLIVGYLAYRSGYVPRFLGVLLAIAGLGYLVDSFGAVLSRGSWTDVSSFTFIGEFLLALWLVIWGRRTTVGTSRFHDDQVEQPTEQVAR